MPGDEVEYKVCWPEGADHAEVPMSTALRRWRAYVRKDTDYQAVGQIKGLATERHQLSSLLNTAFTQKEEVSPLFLFCLPLLPDTSHSALLSLLLLLSAFCLRS